MKQHGSLKHLLIFSLFLLFLSCKKEEAATADCKTCKALGGSGIIEKKICSPAEEQTFRNENAGREISCR